MPEVDMASLNYCYECGVLIGMTDTEEGENETCPNCGVDKGDGWIQGLFTSHAANTLLNV
jgi:uncharacterized paraquat-inducible protein A